MVTQQPVTPAIQIQRLKHIWPGQTHPVIDIANWEVERGEQLFLYGPSGSGKSTLLNLLAGVLVASEGGLRVLGQSLKDMGARARDRFRARHIGFIFQQFNLIPYLSTADNIRLAARFAGTPDTECRRDRLAELMERLKLPVVLLDRSTGTLSIGQQQRVAVARTLINRPELILADEPTSALDQDARYAFLDVLLGTAQENDATVIFVSHDRTLAPHFQRRVSLESINRQGVHDAPIASGDRGIWW